MATTFIHNSSRSLLGQVPPLRQRSLLLSQISSPTIARRLFSSRKHAAARDDDHNSEEELTAARQWLAGFGSNTIPRDICEISFSRSGGPGGQNVNKSVPTHQPIQAYKVNSKATLKVPLDSLLPLVPRILHSPLQATHYIAPRTRSLVIQSEESRKRNENVESCYDKLNQLIKRTAVDAIPGETSQEQKDRVQKLQKAANEARIKSKKFLSSKKSSRRGSNDD
ncbi:peptidyl-tRNA hydrolase domain protein [Aspergillus saccharolyticus JOP 1030-1]|uniref:Peptidyl-tRNA hydrolase domain protein n=1 Tax=Aspergillus saccharolyticus JOP 1030-1 TaxID=1450539 RepID=A0A318Z8C7_9EURO|nr:peptidyl-tRNA hydrolase domain protein [Aspergillus saccharolyticus JOP 1030-1]PYH43581.1 peptidyl-tRNA hydrolase domain protein [Aspergillus saccharolyticus JOP 1030-1]